MTTQSDRVSGEANGSNVVPFHSAVNDSLAGMRLRLSQQDQARVVRTRLTSIVPLGVLLPVALWLLGYHGLAIAAFIAGLALLLITGLGVRLTRMIDIYSVWLFYAISDSLVFWLMSFVVGSYFNVFLFIIIVEIARIYRDAKLVVMTGFLIATAIVAQWVIVWATAMAGWVYLPLLREGDTPTFAAIAYAATAAVAGYSLSTFIERYSREIISYEKVQATNAAELHIAHDIQSSLMAPSELRNGSWEIEAISIPAREVGGDFYEYIPYFGDVNSIGGIAIGDVSGKGIPAALQMAVVRTIFRIEARRRVLPAETLTRVNQSLQTEMPSGMVTLLYAFVDPKQETMHFANAGHNYPIRLNGKVSELKLAGLPLGIYDETEYEEQSVQVPPGTSIIFYTDGVVEARNKENQMYGFPRLLELVSACVGMEPKQILHDIVTSVQVFVGDEAQTDDITVVVMQHGPATGNPTT